MDYEIIFESTRIIFIKLNQKLVQDYLDMINDFDVQKFISHNLKKYSFDDEVEWVTEKIKDNSVIFSMIEKETNDFIGNIEIMHINNNIGELGIAITKLKQNNHYGQEAIKRMIDYSFNDLGLEGLELNVFNFNSRGIRCYEKVGFVKDGIGKSKDDIHMSMKNNNK